MNVIANIVVPLDFGSQTARLVEYAVYIARQFSAALHFFHVVENITTGDMMLGSPTMAPLMEKQLQKATELVSNIVEDHQDDIADITGTVRKGDVVEEVVAFAEIKQADLIIVGTRGARGLEKILLGSVAARILQEAHCPTLVMTPEKINQPTV